MRIRAVLVLMGAVLAGFVPAASAQAATLAVTGTGDPDNGVGSCSTGGSCSLREAVNQANADGGGDGISLPAGTYALDPTLGPLAFTASVTVSGGGASGTLINGAGATQLLTVAAPASVSVDSVTLENGDAVKGDGGAALVAAGAALTIVDDVVSGNTAVSGGAIDDEGTLTVRSSTLTSNTTPGDGGAILEDATGAKSAGATIDDSYFDGNAAGRSGGAISMQSDSAAPSTISMAITGSTFSGNSAATNGGAFADDQGKATLSAYASNSTFEGNIATGTGGGVYVGNNDQPDVFGSDTIFANATGAGGQGGDVGVGAGAAPEFADSIVADGSSPSGADCSGPVVSTGDNLDSGDGCGFVPRPSGTDLVNTDPLLGPLQNNGGPTPTLALEPGSPAIDAYSGGFCQPTDQRGVARPQALGCDIGAYESAPPMPGSATASSVSTTTATLNAAVANPDLEGGTVFFQVSTSSGSYTYTSPAQTLSASTGATAFSAPLSGLTAGTVYQYRVVGQNPDGTVAGPTESFTTAGGPQPTPTPTTTPTPTPPEGNMFTIGAPQVSSSGRLTLSLEAPGAGAFSATATFRARVTVVTHRRGKRVVKHVTGTYTYGTAEANSFAKGTVKLGIGVRGPAGRALKQVGHATVTISILFTPASASPHRESTTVTVRRSRSGGYG